MNVSIPLPELVGFLLALARTTAWMAVSPPFNNRLMPRLVKLGAAVAISMAVAPKMPADKMTLDEGTLMGMVVMQVVTGLVLGFLTQILFSAVQAAGSLIDLFGGFTLSQALDPFGNNQVSVFGRFYQMMAITLLFAINGHLLLVKGFMTTFDVVPLGGVAIDNFKKVLVSDISMFMLAAVEIAGPLLAAYFLSDIAMGLLSKAAPQLNVLTFGMPLKILLTLLMVGSALPLIPGAIHTLLDQNIRDGIHAITFTGGR
jgi:flagellar biosynthesis protein FliR